MDAGHREWSGVGASAGRRPILFGVAVLFVVSVVASACGSSGPTSRPSVSAPTPPSASASTGASPSAGASTSSTPSPAPTASPTDTPAPTPTPAHAATFPVAVIGRDDDTREGFTGAQITSLISTGKVLIPCEFRSLALSGTAIPLPAAPACVALADMTTRVHGVGGTLGLLPPGLVSAAVKVMRIDDADLFGSPTRRAKPYPLVGQSDAATGWEAYDVADIRTLISTGDTCPDRGQSYMAVTKKKGWDWVLDGGGARYRGFKTSAWDWPVPIISRLGNYGATAALMSDNDVSANDFECPMITDWVQHNEGMVFNIDPRVAPLLAGKGGVKAVTLGSNHITDAGLQGVRETLSYLDKAGIKHTGAGRNLADALAPAVVDVRGLKFAFVGWDDIAGSKGAAADRPGVAPMTNDNVCNSIKAARGVADVVIAMPQWGWPEYHATITKQQKTQRQFFYDCGADGILGSGTHWASWVSIWPSTDQTRFAIGSHGNFLFDQSWSRQTMEGVIVEATFSGKRLVQFRLHPYVVVQGAQPCLLNSTTDGAYVLNQVWHVSDVQVTH